jgi:hypothetical protein
MLEHIISKARQIVKDAQNTLPVESAVAIEGVYGDLVNLNNLINQKLNSVENDTNLNANTKRIARREILEKAGRKLEVLKSKRNYASMIEELEVKLSDEPVQKEDSIMKFLHEKEIRDRLVNMTERQIISHFGDSLFDGSNPLLIDAILNAPSGFELLPEEDLKKLREVRVKKMDPKVAAEIDTVRSLEYVIMQMFNLVKDELDNLRRKELPLSLVKTPATGTDSH